MNRDTAVREDAREPTRVRMRHRKGDADRLWVDMSKKPPEQDWNWKRKEVYGDEDRQNLTMIHEMGWEPVDASVFGNGQSGPIERDGMILCERPVELSKEAEAEDNHRAKSELRGSEEKFKVATVTDEFDPRSNPRTRPQIKKSYSSLVAE